MNMDMDLFPLSGMGTGDLDMDFLEDFVPVSDSFLTSYLQQLENNASHQTGGFTAPVTASAGSLISNVTDQVPSLHRDVFPTQDPIGEGNGSQEALLLSGTPVANGSSVPPLSHALHANDHAGVLYAQDAMPQADLGVPLPHANSFKGNASGSTDRSGPNSTGSWDKVDASAIGHHHASDGNDQHGEGTSTSQRKRRDGSKRVRTVAQQQQNKLAQQRYREKRKQKNTELETKVEQLMSQLSALQEVQGQAAQLNGENIALREQVTKQQQIIEDLRLEMKSLAMTADQVPCTANPGACQELCEVAESSSGACKTKEAKLAEFQQRMKATSPEDALKHFGELVNCIQASLTQKGLPTDAFMPGDARYNDPALKTELSRLVGETCLNCMHLFLTRTICPVEKCDTANPDRFRMIPDCEYAKKKWTKCLERVRLTTAQEEILLEQRKELLDSLRRVYADRNRLNLMAIGMMLPNPSQVSSSCFDPSSDAKIKCMEVNGALYCMRTEKQLNDVLDSLKLNLKAEQKLLMEINYKFVHKVLEPAQAAVLMVTAYPSNIDVLALANLLAYHRTYGDIALNKHDDTVKIEAPCPAASIAAQ